MSFLVEVFILVLNHLQLHLIFMLKSKFLYVFLYFSPHITKFFNHKLHFFCKVNVHNVKYNLSFL